MVAIKRYLKNLQELENELGKESPFIRDVTLGRIPDSLGNFWEHEASLRFHKMLPYLVSAFWILQVFFAVNIPLV